MVVETCGLDHQQLVEEGPFPASGLNICPTRFTDVLQ